MEHIAVSVIVPIYNAEPWLEECVQSILDQDFPASYGTIEVLLIDDGATDGSGALCDRLAKRDNRIKVVHQENQGLSGARNTGIDMARGRYYAFIEKKLQRRCGAPGVPEKDVRSLRSARRLHGDLRSGGRTGERQAPAGAGVHPAHAGRCVPRQGSAE